MIINNPKCLSEEDLAKKQRNDAHSLYQLIQESYSYFSKTLVILNTFSHKTNQYEQQQKLPELDQYLNEIIDINKELQETLTIIYEQMQLLSKLTKIMEEEAIKLLGENKIKEPPLEQMTLFEVGKESLKVNIYERPL